MLSGCCRFFYFVEETYAFFTASTYSYELLIYNLKLGTGGNRINVPKRVTTTRWSCRADACKALLQGYSQIHELSTISDDVDEIPETRCKASGLCERMHTLETGIYAVLWQETLDRVNATNKTVQDPKLDFNTVFTSITSLKSFVHSQCECFAVYERSEADISGTAEYVHARQRKRNVHLAPLDYGREPEA